MSATFEKIMNDLQNYKADAEARLEAWKNVKIVTKKNGEHFQSFNKNFEGADIGKYYSVEDSLHPYLTISYHVEDNYKSETSSIEIFYYLDELPDTDERKKAYAQQFMRQTTVMTFEEIENRINIEIKNTEKQITEYEDQIKRAENAYNNFVKAIHDVKINLLKDCGCKNDSNHNSLYYDITENTRFSLL